MREEGTGCGLVDIGWNVLGDTHRSFMDLSWRLSGQGIVLTKHWMQFTEKGT